MKTTHQCAAGIALLAAFASTDARASEPGPRPLDLSGIAAAHGKTSAQIILRWHLQAGNIAIPGSSNEAHIAENYDIFDFALSDGEMASMTALDKNQRFANY